MNNNFMKFISCFSILMFLCELLSFSVVADDNGYEELFNTREEYLSHTYERQLQSCNWGEYHTLAPCIEDNFDHSLAVILYTDVANSLTLKKESDPLESGNKIFNGFSEKESHNFKVVCPEIIEISKKTGSTLRALVNHYEIDKQELIEAYDKMKNDPDYIRTVLSFLSDEEFESGRNEDGYFGTWDVPEFFIDALYIEDNDLSQNLLCMPFAVYVKELGDYVCDANLLEVSYQVIVSEDKEFYEFLNFDLTNLGMDNFMKYLDNLTNTDVFERNSELNSKRIQMIKSEREKQLANPKTGEPVYLVPAAIASLTLGIYAAYPRKKRKLEA